MKSVLLSVAIAGLVAAGAASAQDGAAVAQKSGCLNCHAVDTKKVGPPLKDAAAKLKGKSNAEAVAAIKGSKAHAQPQGIGRGPDHDQHVDAVGVRARRNVAAATRRNRQRGWRPYSGTFSKEQRG